MNILLEGIFYNGHGFAEGNRILLRILDQAGFRVRIVPWDTNERKLVLDADEAAYISSFEHTRLKSNDVYLYNFVGSSIRHRPEFRFTIARTTFETDRIPASWVPQLNQFDEVWVQSRFNIDTFTSSGVQVPLRHIPNFFDTGAFDVYTEPLRLPVAETFKFLSIFDLQLRKGYDVLLDAFLQEFSDKDDAALIIKVRSDQQLIKLLAYIDDHPTLRERRPPVYIIDQMLHMRELLGLYKACDAFVLPTRGEGWGRPYFEAMLMCMPVIATNWSGHLDYMNEENAYLIDVDRLVRIKDSDFPMFNGHYWANPSIKDLRAKMRHVYENREEAQSVGKRAREDILRSYDMRRVADMVVEEIYKYAKLL
ncbi:glycosyltransferase family 4 protein [Paenibacillus hexagrammi]|uniref:Glycosyltransferase family 4 protein n=1 Tax=Paenibacillus hexagrammi TaxID=2908839 RepID=A0ABY3SF60_9BACL|nr:glycosyltransferase family 4 protein [Paenibacillus sp. YPD9-1]UJF32100.1 glycosyltransferase family 4 protein [Paenibacillus sp. YPD9-1]